MKDNVSLVFAAIIGILLIVILPLYSILDRQDSMSYNVVNTLTTQFVDEARNKGFIDNESYLNYISALSATGNTYKVEMEAYRKVLIRSTNADGSLNNNSYKEEIEMDNTQDVLEKISSKETVEGANDKKTNNKSGVYLFNVGDEFYIKVYNTNITSGSLIYSFIAGETNSKVIDISYGGAINKINWELYDKLQISNEIIPEVIMGVPENAEGSSNLKAITEQGEAIGVQEKKDEEGNVVLDEAGNIVYEDVYAEGKLTYAYVYDIKDLKDEDGNSINNPNKTIKISVELRNFEKIDGKPFQEIKTNEQLKKIADKYIELNGMYADTSYEIRAYEDYYKFNIVLSNVRMSSLDYIYQIASVTIMPGLCTSAEGVESLGAQSVNIELMDEESVHTVVISAPHLWEAVLKEKRLDARITQINNKKVYTGVDIAFQIQYTGVHADLTHVKEAILANLKIYHADAERSEIEIIDRDTAKDQYGIEVSGFNTLLVKFKYLNPTTVERVYYEENYLELLSGWISLEPSDEEIAGETAVETQKLDARGAKSSVYTVETDTVPPAKPVIGLEGEVGQDNWYNANVKLTVVPSEIDFVTSREDVTKEEQGGSGVSRNTLQITGATEFQESEENEYIVEKEGRSFARAFAYDYAGNKAESDIIEIKIDKTAPTKPVIEASGEKTLETNEWYTDNVTFNITPGADALSGVIKTEYLLSGAGSTSTEWQELNTERKVIVSAEGETTIKVRTVDKAGNVSVVAIQTVKIDKSNLTEPELSITSGEKNNGSNWYYTNVVITAKVGTESTSGISSRYEVKRGTEKVGSGDIEGGQTSITINENGIDYSVTVTTTNGAGRTISKTIDGIYIDKNRPNAPTIEMDKAESPNKWYNENVKVIIKDNGDVGPSNVKAVNGILYKDNVETNMRYYTGEITLINGKHSIQAYVLDNAGNNSETTTKEINVDTIPPIPAQIVGEGTKGSNGWYKSDIILSVSGGEDSLSGIASRVLSQNKITENTTNEGIRITCVATDNAGNKSTSEETFKLDKTAPTEPTIVLSEPTGGVMFGTSYYNKNVDVTIKGGEDGQSGVVKSTYEIIGDSNTNVTDFEGEETFTISNEGVSTIVVTTIDNAGNSTEVSTTVVIDKSVPSVPTIEKINGTEITTDGQIIIDTSNLLNIVASGIQENYVVKVKLTNQETTEETIYNGLMDITLVEKGTYKIEITVTNVYGSTAKSTQLCYYKYE